MNIHTQLETTLIAYQYVLGDTQSLVRFITHNRITGIFQHIFPDINFDEVELNIDKDRIKDRMFSLEKLVDELIESKIKLDHNEIILAKILLFVLSKHSSHFGEDVSFIYPAYLKLYELAYFA